MFQSYAFQPVAFQTVATNDNGWLGGGGGYKRPYQKYKEEEAQREKIRREKSELEKLESVLAENERKAEIAAQNKLIASARRSIALAKAEAEYLAEIDRLLKVRAELMRRIKEDEAILVILMMMKRRKLRVA
jgi:hypothetical protein